MNTNTNINIFNSTLYENEINDDEISILLEEYWKITKDYFRFLIENVKIKEDKTHFYFIFIRGLNTFKYIFNFLLIYTKNLKIIIYHLKKAYLYYVEFVGQIGHDNHAYLQLNSRDATLFVYKKTIYEINNDHKKKIIMSDEDKYKYKEIYDMISNINSLIEMIIRDEEKILYENYLLKFKLLDKIISKIKKNYSKINIKILIKFLDKILYIYKDENQKKFNILEIINIFVNKLIKNKIQEDFANKLLSCKNIIEIKKLSSVKYVNWLIK